MKSNLYLGIDVSKGYADFSMLSADRKMIRNSFQLLDMNKGHLALEQYLKHVVKEQRPKMIYAAVESTGGYENHWMKVLSGLSEYLPIMVARLNPVGVAKHRQADLKHQVTDKSSSVAIARYLINHIDRVKFNTEDKFKRHRSSLSYIELLDKQRTQLINHLRQQLYQAFPEVLAFCRSGMSNKVLELLKLYPTSYNMAKARQGKNNGIGYLSEEKWLHLRKTSKLGTMTEADPLAEALIRDSAQNIQDLTRKIDKFRDQLIEELPQDQVNLLTSIPGIGKRSAAILLCIIGDVRRFKNARQVVGFFGLYPVIKESGDVSNKPRLSRRGNMLLRKTLFMCAMVACNHDPYLGGIYRKSVERGMAKKAAICKIMTKMLRIIYGLLVHNRKYNPAIDQNNRDKFMSRSTSIKSLQPKEEIEGLVALIAHAPISRKNANIRKEQLRASIMTQGHQTTSATPSIFFQEHDKQKHSSCQEEKA